MKSTNKSFPNADNIIDKLKLFYNLSSDAALAKILNIRPNTLAIWKMRNSVDLKKIFEQCPQIDFNWLLDKAVTDVPLVSNIVTGEAFQDLFRSYKTKGPIVSNNAIYCVDGAHFDQYPKRKEQKNFFKSLPVITIPKCIDWSSHTRMFKSAMSKNEWIIASYCFDPWHLKSGDKVWFVTGLEIVYGELLSEIGIDYKELQYKTIAGKINTIKIQNLEEAWLAKEKITPVSTVELSAINARIKALESRLMPA